DSIRVLEFDASGNFIGEKTGRFNKDNDFDIGINPSGRLLWLMDGTTLLNTSRYFYLYFDTTENGAKPVSVHTELPENGKLIAFSGYWGDTYTMASNGDGTFGSEVHVDTIANSLLNGIVLSDFNNDDFPDIISGDNYQNIYYYQNTADGTDTFLPKINIGNIESGTKVQDITAADYNNDGNQDFVVNMWASDLYLFTGNGDGTFTRSKITNGMNMSYRGKASADINKDGNIDLIVGEYNYGIVYIFYGNGDGTFESPVEAVNMKKTVLVNESIYGIAAGDVDNDGFMDIVINSMRGSGFILRSMYWEPDGIIFKPLEEVPTLKIADSAGYADLDLVDINGDGKLDIMAARYIDASNFPPVSYLMYFEGSGDGSFKPYVTVPTSTYNTPSVSASTLSPEIIVNLGMPEEIKHQVYEFVWNTGNTLVGDYVVTATTYDLSSNQVARQSTPISIVPTGGIVANFVPDKTSYSPNETAEITANVTNESLNRMYENMTATIVVEDLNGQVIFSEVNTIDLLTPSGFSSFKTYWNISTHPSGDYPAILEVKDASGNVLSTITKNLTISSMVDPSTLLLGQISVEQQSLLQGEPVNISYSVTNSGNIDLSQVDLSILTLNTVDLSTYDTLTDQTALMMSQTYASSKALNTINYTAKDYLVILRANIGGIEETLAGTYFRIEGAPTAPSLNSPSDGADVDTLMPMLVVNNASDPNDDDLTYQFEVYSDSGMTALAASSPVIAEETNTTSWQLPLELLENQTYYWRARAYDGLLYSGWMQPASFRVNVLNDPPTAPTLSSPADYSEADTLTPILTVNNATDPDSDNLTYNFEIAYDIDFTQTAASHIGIFEGAGTTSWQVPVNLTENTWYYWRAQADDWFIEGPWMTPARFFINTANDAPSAPSIISPLNGSEITALFADITVSNSFDPDSSQLTYMFEVDTADSFDSAGLIMSSGIPEGQGTTSWRAEGLNDNTYYYARTKASDGLAESPWSDVVSFFVNTHNDAPTTPALANPSNGSGVNVFSPVLSIHNSTDIDH
ncbi:MAG: FG-GAP-like repeat-containing protein, partial [Nitrospirota bacterium]